LSPILCHFQGNFDVVVALMLGECGNLLKEINALVPASPPQHCLNNARTGKVVDVIGNNRFTQ
jgi:hypothetical protein